MVSVCQLELRGKYEGNDKGIVKGGSTVPEIFFFLVVKISALTLQVD